MKWHQADRGLSFGAQSNRYAHIQNIMHRLYKSYAHTWFYAQEPIREVSGPILRGVEEQVHKGTCSPCSGRCPPFQNLLEIKRQL